jgi:arginase
MFDTIGLIGVPSSAGSHYAGQEKAPQALRRAGLVADLERCGVKVSDFGDLPLALYQPRSADRQQQNLTRVVEVAQRVADRVDEVLKQQLTPVVIGGDCTITLGALSGYLRHVENLGLLYFDGDVDLSTPDTSQSGIFDAMGIAHLLGEGAEALSHLGPRFPLMRADHLALFGFHPWEVDERAWEVLKQRQILHFPVTTFHGHSAQIAQQAISQLEERVDVVLVHFDVDAIDSADCPLANFPHHNQGLPLSEALACLSIFCSSAKCGGMVLTELNPDHDGDGSLVPTFTRLLVQALTGIGGPQTT